ncbi:MAG: hypothetical protein LBN98_03560 [Prevotellaceae bacterium]|jgi:hypothetical protein|nr:hypothetical protein [Prevotellaceae bacterium]
MKSPAIQLTENFDLRIHIIRDATGLITSGLAIGDVTAQNQAIILVAHKGEFKEHPTLGVGLNDIINDNNSSFWEHRIAEQIQADGQHITRLSLDETGLILEAAYPNN